MRKPVGRLHESNAGVAQDPLGELMKILYDEGYRLSVDAEPTSL